MYTIYPLAWHLLPVIYLEKKNRTNAQIYTSSIRLFIAILVVVLEVGNNLNVYKYGLS